MFVQQNNVNFLSKCTPEFIVFNLSWKSLKSERRLTEYNKSALNVPQEHTLYLWDALGRYINIPFQIERISIGGIRVFRGYCNRVCNWGGN